MYRAGTRWKCQCCGAGGTALDFLMQYERIDVVAAARLLDPTPSPNLAGAAGTTAGAAVPIGARPARMALAAPPRPAGAAEGPRGPRLARSGLASGT